MNILEKTGKVGAAGVAVLTTLILAVIKLALGIFIGSFAVIAEAIHSGMDLFSALIGFFAVRQSSVPPDDSHPFGHGKYETMAGGFESIILLIASGSIVFFSIREFLSGPHPIEAGIGIWVMLGTGAVNFGIARYLFWASKKYDSFAIEGNAWHLMADALPSLGVVMGLMAVKFLNWYWADSLIAMLIGIYIGLVGFRLIGRAFRGLTDHSLPRDEKAKIKSIIQSHYPQVLEFHKLRTRKSGNERHIDLHIVMKRNTPLDLVHELCDQIEDEIKKCFPSCKILVHVEPCQVLGICEKGKCPLVNKDSDYLCPLDEPNFRGRHLKLSKS
ncbi:MAG: cation transporter [Candidatus Eremiobacteraeota bacterium]|nr:cation transporter [Candidatus Eremiobacteraeota bacterium]